MKNLMLIVALLMALPGCVAWEIRDEVRTTNQHLCEVTPAIGHTIAMVEETNQKIAETNSRLVEMQAEVTLTQAEISAARASIHDVQGSIEAVQASVQQIDGHLVTVDTTLAATNPKLNNLDDGLVRMKILEDVHVTLKEIDAALAPLSKAMGSLGSAASFLGLSDGSKDLLADEDAAPPPPHPPAGGAPADAKPGTKAAGEPAVAESPATGDAGKHLDIILGTWVMVYPPPSPPQTAGRIVVISADGKFIAAENSQAPETGTWSRKGRTLTYQFDAKSGKTARATEIVDLLTLNTRTLTTKRGDVISVYARP